MPPNPKHDAITAHPLRWELFGTLLQARRRSLGYATRAAFEHERQVKSWVVNAFERAGRRSIDPDVLQFVSHAYGFTSDSALAVLAGDADTLTFTPLEPVVPPGPSATLPPAAPRRKRERPAVNRKHHAIDTAPRERWQLLGRLLRVRRVELGYRFRPAFAAARLPRTPDGNLMIRALNAIENAERPGTYPPEALAQFARAYDVTEESVYAVLEGKSDRLAPQAQAAAVPPEPEWQPPIAEPGRRDADRAYADRIYERLLALAGEGNLNPSGEQLFPASPADAKTWDGTAGRMAVRDRVWLVADMQRRAAGRDGGRSAPSASGSLRRGNIAGERSRGRRG